MATILSDLLLGACTVFGIRSGTEEPPYKVLDHVGMVEIRQYDARTAAETTIENDEEAARSDGFRKLAKYIFGGNTVRQIRTAHQQLSAFLLRRERIYRDGRKAWTKAHRGWLADQSFAQPAQQIVLEENIEAVRLSERRRDRIDGDPDARAIESEDCPKRQSITVYDRCGVHCPELPSLFLNRPG